MRGRGLQWVLLVVPLATFGCYDPKADIDRLRPEGAKRLAAMESIAKVVSALPPLTTDTLRLPQGVKPHFARPGKTAAVTGLSTLSDVEKNGPRVYGQGAWQLMKWGHNGAGNKPDKREVESAFQELLSLEYLLVTRTREMKEAVLAGDKFLPGNIVEEAYLCEVKEGRTCYGGFAYSAVNSDKVSAYVRKGNEADHLKSLLRADLGQQASNALKPVFERYFPGEVY